MRTLQEDLRTRLRMAGAVSVGFTSVREVDSQAVSSFKQWIGQGRHGSLHYMENYPELRFNPNGLLPGAHTLISIAWPYLPERMREPSLPFIARYAYAPDYHKSIRKLIKPILKSLTAPLDTRWRICVDSAPIMERYWAVRCGVGFIGRNGCLIVPGYGSWVFLSEILTNLCFEPDAPCTESCHGCDACVKNCPTGALNAGSSPDCRLCLSALTVEQPGGAPLLNQGQYTLAGCDRCQEVCVHNRNAVAHNIAMFRPTVQFMKLSASHIAQMSEAEFDVQFKGSALSRIGLEGLRANLKAMGTPSVKPQNTNIH